MSPRPDLNATSLSFFLVTPVQRMARYPLLLQTVQKHTDVSHPSYRLLQQAVDASIALNRRINEYKRFREVGQTPPSCRPGSGSRTGPGRLLSFDPGLTLGPLIPADKYKRPEQLSIKDKINRISPHSIAKKTARISQYLKHEAGLTPKVSSSTPITLQSSHQRKSALFTLLWSSSWWMKSSMLWKGSSTLWKTPSWLCWRTWRCSCTTCRYVPTGRGSADPSQVLQPSSGGSAEVPVLQSRRL